ncbi:MAG: MFS transporter [Proteobacteria bacterium]|nr:MFS transporter [Pseudomonadota bacterium]
MRLMISFAALFLSAVLLQLSSGGVVPLDALSGIQLGFTTTEVGILGSMHFTGFLIGCWLAPRLMGTVGHSRAFAAFTALGAIGILSHMMLVNPTAWALMRMMTGLCVAGCYTVIEAWMQAKLTNLNRGKVMGAYRVIDLGGSLAAQMMISILTPAAYMSYNLLAILCCASLFPLTLTKAEPPEVSAAPRLRPIMAFRLSPLAVAGVIVAGLNGASFRMVGPVYAQEIGLTVSQIGLFLAVYVLGGAVAQIPIGYFADKVDRRWVLIILSIGTMASATAITLITPGMVTTVFVAIFFFGITSIPIYSVSTAHGNDFARPDQVVELNASYMLWYAIGAIASPLFASMLIQSFGPPALFYFIAFVHFVLITYSLLRMRSRPTNERRTAYAYMPRTTFVLGKLLRRKSDRPPTPKGPDTP